MSNGVTGDWGDKKKKREAILRVLKHIVANPGAGLGCVNNDPEAHRLFEDRTLGNIVIPPGGRVVIFGNGEEDLLFGGSLIIELPPANPRLPMTSPNPSDRELLSYVLGNYKYW